MEIKQKESILNALQQKALDALDEDVFAALKKELGITD